MRANLGFLLIGLGLVGIYVILGGKFKTGQKAVNGTEKVGQFAKPFTPAFASNPVPVTGGASQPANVPYIPANSYGAHETPKDPTTNSPIGSGGQSWQSKWTQFGQIVSIQPMDRTASRGGF
jgi:hypothetical protein